MKRTLDLLALALLGSLAIGKSHAALGLISTTLNPAGPVNLNDTFVVSVSISGYTEATQIDAFQFRVTYPTALFTYVGPIDHGTTGAGATQQWLAKASQETTANGYSPTASSDGSVPGVVLIDLADLGFTDPEGGTVANSGFLASFTLQAVGVGTGSITPAAPAGGVVFFDVNLASAGTPSFSGTDMSVIPEPGVAVLAVAALGMFARRRRR